MSEADFLATLSAPTWDLFIILFFALAAFFYGFSLGRDRLIVLLIATYMALAVVNYAPFIATLKPNLEAAAPLFAFQVSAFLGVFALLFLVLSGSALLNALTAGLQGSWWQVMLFGVLQAGLLISVVLSFLPADALEAFSDQTRSVFTGEFGRFLWVTLPIVALVFLERGGRS